MRMLNRLQSERGTTLIETVVALGVGARCDESGEDNVVAPILEKLGYKLDRAKTNIGLGRKDLRDLSNTASGSHVNYTPVREKELVSA